eukprot:scaffold50460_cov52-Phaeocystis_antarctica.AAC.1
MDGTMHAHLAKSRVLAPVESAVVLGSTPSNAHVASPWEVSSPSRKWSESAPTGRAGNGLAFTPAAHATTMSGRSTMCFQDGR